MSIAQNIKTILIQKLKELQQKKHRMEFAQIVGESKNGKANFIH